MGKVARHLMISGRVQGVFFRNWTVDTAKAMGLGGWVRNRMDGSVEALVEGPAEAVERFIALAHEGPPAAQVARVDVEEAAVQGLAALEKRASC